MIPSIGVCDGIAMGHEGMKYSLASRELIADSLETMAMAHCLDGLVLIPNCDKIVPGMVMAAARLDIPAIVCSGGPMMPGKLGSREIDLNTVFEAVGSRKANLITDEGLTEIEQNACPGCGSCAGMFTANSLNCLCEAIGIALPGNGTIPAISSGRIRLAKEAGMKIMQNRLNILWTFGVEKGKISRSKLVDLFATSPSKINGLETKGQLEVGFDGDVVIFDPNYAGTISVKNNLEGVDYCPFEGFEQIGRPETVFLRGAKIVENGKYVGEKGQGRFVPGKPFGDAYK